MRISDWSSDVCSSDLNHVRRPDEVDRLRRIERQAAESRANAPAGAGDMGLTIVGRAAQIDELTPIGLQCRRRRDGCYRRQRHVQIGRASWWERVCQYV